MSDEYNFNHVRELTYREKVFGGESLPSGCELRRTEIGDITIIDIVDKSIDPARPIVLARSKRDADGVITYSHAPLKSVYNQRYVI